jgi:hypothetical protein
LRGILKTISRVSSIINSRLAMDRQSLHAQYAEFATDVDEWFFTAENLLGAAEVLEPLIEEYWAIERERNRKREATGKVLIFPYQPDPRGIYFMLTAYALENLCKGLLIKKKLSTIQSGTAESGELPRDVIHHNLSELLRRIGFDAKPEDAELAFRLERSAVWSARYPVPTRAEHRTVHMRTTEGEEIVPTWHKEDDVKTVKSFASRVDQFVIEQLKETP